MVIECPTCGTLVNQAMYDAYHKKRCRDKSEIDTKTMYATHDAYEEAAKVDKIININLGKHPINSSPESIQFWAIFVRTIMTGIDLIDIEMNSIDKEG